MQYIKKYSSWLAPVVVLAIGWNIPKIANKVLDHSGQATSYLRIVEKDGSKIGTHVLVLDCTRCKERHLVNATEWYPVTQTNTSDGMILETKFSDKCTISALPWKNPTAVSSDTVLADLKKKDVK